MRRRAALAAVTVLLVLLAASPTAAQTPTPPAPPTLIEVVEQTPWVPPGGAFALRLRIHDAPAGARLSYRVHRQVPDRSTFERTLAFESLGSRLLGPVLADLVPPFVGADGTLLIRIPTGDTDPGVTPLDLPRAGVYPVVVEVQDADGAVLDRIVTYLVLLPAESPDAVPLAVAVLAPMHAAPAHRSPGISEPVNGAVEPILDALDAHPDAPITILPTPETLAAAGDTDTDLAARIASVAAHNELVASPWVRVDPIAWQQAGLGDLLDVERVRGIAELERALRRSPDLDTAVFGPGAGVLDVAVAAASGARSVVVAEQDLEPVDGGAFPRTLTRPFRLELDPNSGLAIPALAADTALAAHHGSTGRPVLDAQHLLADLAMLSGDEPANQRVAVVALDDDAAGDAPFLDALLAGLEPPTVAPTPADTDPTDLVVPPAPPAPEAAVTAVTLASAFDLVEPAGADGGADPANPLVRRLLEPGGSATVPADLAGDLHDLDADIASYRSVFGADDPLGAQAADLVLTAGAAELTPADRRPIVDLTRLAIQDALGAIAPPAEQRVTLTAREGHVQLLVTNNASTPADVTLVLEGERLELPDHPDGRVPVRLEPGTNRVDVLLRARASGDARLDLRLTSPDGRLVLGDARLTVRTTAVSGVGIVLMGAAALFLVIWWTRTIVRERRAARARHPAHSPA